MRNAIKWFIVKTKPIVKRFAHAYDIATYDHAITKGKHPLIITGGEEAARNRIPKSVVFNTMCGPIKIGHNTAFGDNVMVLTGKHMNISESKEHNVELHRVPASGREISIGDGCFIGAGAIIIGPVTIGNHSVVAAGAVVTKDVPERSMVAGVPAKIIRRF